MSKKPLTGLATPSMDSENHTSMPLKRQTVMARDNKKPYGYKGINFPLKAPPLLGINLENVESLFDPSEPNICVNNRLSTLSVNSLDEGIENCPARDLTKR